MQTPYCATFLLLIASFLLYADSSLPYLPDVYIDPDTQEVGYLYRPYISVRLGYEGTTAGRPAAVATAQFRDDIANLGAHGARGGQEGDGGDKLMRTENPQHRPRSWVDPRAEVRPSPIEGDGLFATAPIAAGETVMVLGGTVIDDRQLAELQPHSSLAIAEGLNLMQDGDDASHCGNHSCHPNLWMADAVTVVARRDIQQDEELTIDYALMTVVPWKMECRCGASTCRATITGDDWKLPELQLRYKGHFSPFINERIRRKATSL